MNDLHSQIIQNQTTDNRNQTIGDMLSFVPDAITTTSDQAHTAESLVSTNLTEPTESISSLTETLNTDIAENVSSITEISELASNVMETIGSEIAEASSTIVETVTEIVSGILS